MITTKRLHIRPIVEADDEFIVELFNSKGWITYIGDRGIRTKEDALNYITTIKNKSSFQYLVIEKINSSLPMGILSFIKRTDFDFPDLGFALLPEYQSKGYAKEACEGYLQMLLKQHSSIKVLALCMETNKPSLHLLNKLGFIFSHFKKVNDRQLKVFELMRTN